VTTSMRQAMAPAAGGHNLLVEAVKDGTPGANEPAPRSDAPAPPVNADPFARSKVAVDPNELKPTAPDASELKTSGPPDPNELKPTGGSQSAALGDAPAAPPVQVNEIQPGQASSGGGAVASSSSDLASDKDISSSKKKKKKGLKKILVF
jgi:hypothetical protein